MDWKIFFNQTPIENWQSGDNAALAAAYDFIGQISARMGFTWPQRYIDPTPDCPGDVSDGRTFINVHPGRGVAVPIYPEALAVAEDIVNAAVAPIATNHTGDALPPDIDGRLWGMPAGGFFRQMSPRASAASQRTGLQDIGELTRQSAEKRAAPWEPPPRPVRRTGRS